MVSRHGLSVPLGRILASSMAKTCAQNESGAHRRRHGILSLAFQVHNLSSVAIRKALIMANDQAGARISSRPGAALAFKYYVEYIHVLKNTMGLPLALPLLHGNGCAHGPYASPSSSFDFSILFFFFCCGGGAAGERRLYESLSRLRRVRGEVRD
ncbi:hypothetical protein DFH08DRAFT_879608 [Mycena albidolilacea]|uniref:Uncharacterized protein n=1 Tax=Mycena albidolilacea TaxID=1033008 RepID=A0AAD6ZR51_9AGAR|nr:hypothetical protein DFH08DRAFT_879608 [Mycena albidolilacea]